MTDGHPISGMEDKIEAGSPLRLLVIASYEPVIEASKRLSALYEGWEADELVWMLKTALLQAHYNLPNDLVQEHFKFHELFNWFCTGGEKQIQFNENRYLIFLNKALEDHELKQFFHAVIKNLNDQHTKLDLDDMRLRLMRKLSDWAETNSPRIVYFGMLSHSPLKRITFSLSCDSDRIITNEFLELAKKLCPIDEGAQFERYRQQAFEEMEEHDTESEEALEDDEQEEWAYDNEDDQLNLMSEDEERRLYVQRNFISMDIEPKKFDSWEDTVRPFAEKIVETCRPTKRVLDALYLSFENTILMPPGADLSEFFYMLPVLPPKIVPPAFMREQKHEYYLPQRAMSGHYTTDLLYDSFGQYLTLSFDFNPKEDYLEVKLRLSIHWQDQIYIDDVLERFDCMKTSLNAAFHSILKDRMIHIFE